MKPKILQVISDEEFVKLVKRYLRKNDITQVVLADEIGVSPVAMSKILNGQMPPTPKLCERFDCKREKLIVVGEIKNE